MASPSSGERPINVTDSYKATTAQNQPSGQVHLSGSSAEQQNQLSCKPPFHGVLDIFSNISSVAGSLVLANSEINQAFTPDPVMHFASSNDARTSLGSNLAQRDFEREE